MCFEIDSTTCDRGNVFIHMQCVSSQLVCAMWLHLFIVSLENLNRDILEMIIIIM